MRIHDILDSAVAASPDAIAIYDGDAPAWTYATLSRAVADAAALLRSYGVARGDRVLMVTENCATLCAFIYACSFVGAWAVPVNARMTQTELARIVDHATPSITLFMAAGSAEADSHADRAGAQDALGSWGRVRVAQTGPSDPAPEAEVAVLLYTTGTTGTPKGVMLTHGNLIFAGETSATTRGMTPTDIVYGVLPMTHVFGLASMFIAASCARAAIRLEARFTAANLYHALADGVTILPAVPQMHALLMQYTREQKQPSLKGGALRYVSSGAAPLDPVWKQNAEAFYGIALQNGYGMTETTAGVCTTKNAIGDPDISVGPPLAEVEIKIDEAAQGGGDGSGEVLTRGPHIMLGYFRNPDATKAAICADGWLRTGDLGKIDSKGRLHILGRSKELIIRGGFNVYPPEVEAALNDHPQVVQSAVIGRRTETGDEDVLAFVQIPTDSTLTEDDLRLFVQPRLSAYKRPARIILAETLPAAPTGKLLKHKLLDAFADQL